MANIECETCGGTDFYKDSGHFYCKECQTQTQEIQEHVFEEEFASANTRNVKKTGKNIQEKLENKITSWECYNIILCGLTQQLIDLGAKPDLKPIVKCLWMKYLEKLEVITKNDDLPKLPIINNRKDAEILFGITPRKKKRRNSARSTSDESLNTTVSLKRQRSKKKRALAEVQLEEATLKSLPDSNSLHNETLTSIKSTSEKSCQVNNKIKYNKYAEKELRTFLCKSHIKKHLHDFDKKLKCHKIKSKNLSYKYLKTVITTTKLYCLLYLGLLISKDNIQLGDLLRFINEGHITFNYFTYLFPEEYADKFLNTQQPSSTGISNPRFRKSAAELAKFLGVTRYINTPDLVELTKRYCKELNLPGDISLLVINLISHSLPHLSMTESSATIPNYEGRVMSMILVILKLLFGLDGMTEHELSKYSNICNEYLEKPKMFNFIEWFKHIKYRSMIINKYHFPTQYSNDQSVVDSDLYLQYIATKPKQYNEDVILTSTMQDYNEILTRINRLEPDVTSLEFPHSLTPFSDYSQVLLRSFTFQSKPYLKELLKQNFCETSVDYLVNPLKYLELVNQGEEINIKNGGLNDNFQINEMRTCNVEAEEMNIRNKKLVTLAVKKEEDLSSIVEIKKTTIKVDTSNFLKEFQVGREGRYKLNKKTLKKLSTDIDVTLKEDPEVADTYSQHFHPYERYWMNYTRYPELHSTVKFAEFFNEYPYSFRLIFDEMVRILEQAHKDFFLEFQLTEVYLVYGAKIKGESPCKVKGLKLRNLVNRAKRNW